MAIYLDTDPWSGAVETFDYDESDDRIIIARTCDVQPVIDANKRAQANNNLDYRKSDMWLAARIPVDVALIWLTEYGISCWRKEHWPAVQRLLNDNEWRYLRVNEFRI